VTRTEQIEALLRSLFDYVIGIGKGVVDRLREMKADGHPDLEGVEIHGVNVGERSSQPERFVNLRAELWWDVGRVLSEEGGWDLHLMDDDLAAALSSPTYTFDSAGRIRVQPKDETREAIGRSPDDADALLLAFHHPAVGDAGSVSTIPPGENVVVERGDLRLVGRKYLDKE